MAMMQISHDPHHDPDAADAPLIPRRRNRATTGPRPVGQGSASAPPDTTQPATAGQGTAQPASAAQGGASTTPTPIRRPKTRTASELVTSGDVTPQQAYAATLVLARLHDRRVALNMTLEEMCEVLGYLGEGRRPESVPPDQVMPPHLRGTASDSARRPQTS